MGSISHHIMPLVINSLGGGLIHMNVHAYIHRHTHIHTDTHIHTQTHTNTHRHTHIPISHTKAILGNQLYVPAMHVSIIL